ncbi:MAG: tyrosine-type recombinase/integrase [Flavobacteriales bacterium]
MISKHITLKHLLIDNSKKVGFQFKFDKVTKALLQTLPELQWSKEFNLYYLDNTKKNISLIFETFKGTVWVNGDYFFDKKKNGSEPAPVSVNEFRNRKPKQGVRYCPEAMYQKLELKHYSNNTARVYINLFEKFINEQGQTPLLEIDEITIKNYLNQLVSKGKSTSYVNQMINAIKFYYEVVLSMPNRFYSIDRPRKKEQLPKVLSVEEVQSILNCTPNIKHRCIISLLYSAGLRRSELLNLRIEHIDSKRMVILVKDAKGGKDRQTLLSKSVLDELRHYYKEYKPEEFLFEGLHGKQYSGTSVGKLVANSAKRARIRKKVTPHMLRHSFATHLLEDKVDLRYIQVLLGHNSSKTSEIYTQVATNQLQQIKSPIDLLNLR